MASRLIRSAAFWIILALGSLIAGVVLFFMFGGTPQPTDTHAGLLKTENSAMAKGNPDAPVKMVEYADLLCPYCAKFSKMTMPLLQTDYISKGNVYIEFRPIAIIAGDSGRAAASTYCAAEQNKFWDYTDLAYDRTWNVYYSKGMKPEEVPIFNGDKIYQLAEDAKLDLPDFKTCLESNKYTKTVADATAAAQQSGLSGTPFFLINKQVYNGYAPYDVVKTTIESYLTK